MSVDILLLITWKTWANLPLLDQRSADRLTSLLPELAIMHGATVLELAAVPTHVHMVAEMGLPIDVPILVQRLKGAPARLINLDRGTMNRIRWAPGYDARSISRRNLPDVRRYFDRQGEHHGMVLLARSSVSVPLARNRPRPHAC